MPSFPKCLVQRHCKAAAAHGPARPAIAAAACVAHPLPTPAFIAIALYRQASAYRIDPERGSLLEWRPKMCSRLTLTYNKSVNMDDCRSTDVVFLHNFFFKTSTSTACQPLLGQLTTISSSAATVASSSLVIAAPGITRCAPYRASAMSTMLPTMPGP